MERVNLVIYVLVCFFGLLLATLHAIGAEPVGVAGGSQADINGTITEPEFANYPSWFPRKRCKETWNRKPRTYNFSREKFPKDLANETQAYADYKSNLESKVTPRNECYKTWSVLVVMDAASDLHGYATWDLYEMEAAFKSGRRWAGSTLTKDVLVQHTGFDDEGTRRLHIFQQPYEHDEAKCKADANCKNFEVKPREFFIKPSIKAQPLAGDEAIYDRWRGNKDVTWLDSPVVEKFSNDAHSSKLDRLKDFLDWGIRNYPSKYTLVVVWGHGMGWLEVPKAGETIGDHSVLHLRGHELAGAVKWAQETIFEGKRKIDNVFTDACHMQSIEIAAELAPYVRFYTGSAQVQTFLGLPYRTIGFNMGKSFKNLKQMQVKSFMEANPGAPKPSEDDFPVTDEPLAIADLTPELMRRTLNDKLGFQGRVDSQSEEFANGSTFFTYASFDSEAILMETLPALDRLAKSIIEYMKEPMDLRDQEDRAFFFMEKLNKSFPFHTTVKTRELGNFIHSVRESVEKENSLSEFEPEETCSEVLFDSLPTPAHKVQCAAYLARMGVQAAIVRKEFSSTYDGKDFEGVAVWVPRNIGAYRLQSDYFANTRMMRFGLGADVEGLGSWGEMLKLVSELAK